jgi:hypothetical protein
MDIGPTKRGGDNTWATQKAGPSDKLQHRTAVDQQITEHLHVPQDPTSPRLLKGEPAEMKNKVVPLDSPTGGIGRFFSGDASGYRACIRDISGARSRLGVRTK